MFRVMWTEAAVQAMVAAFENADPSRQEAITRGLDRLDAVLSYDGRNFGESREDPIRIGFDGPCGIYFVADDPAEGDVRVLDFWLTIPRA